MVINLSSLPQETIEKYDLIELSQDGKLYIEIQKGMYGLPQAGILANELLQRNLAKDGYRKTTHTGDQIEYPGDKSTRTEGLTTAKILINSFISTLGAKFLVIDISNF
jgi:hypothetical protein